MNKVRSSFIVTIFLLGFLSSKAQTDADPDPAAKPYNGHYVAYKWVNEDVTGMDGSEADSWLKEGMSIRPDRFFLFTDTIRHPRYEKRKEDTDHFFYHYTVRENGNRLSRLFKDTVTYLAVIKDEGVVDRRIMITATDLIVNYKGFFYFFKRNKSVSATKKRS